MNTKAMLHKESNMKKKYRVTFNDGPTGNKYKDVDIEAECLDEAVSLAYAMPEAKSRIYSDIDVSEIEEGPKVIGIKFKYEDTALKQNFTGYLFIRANDEKQAVEYYNKHYKGGRFWHNPSKDEPDGKCIRGEVQRTYFAAFPGYDADATV